MIIIGFKPHLDYKEHDYQLNSKNKRLAIECSKLGTECLPGQKWRCEREGHRWRKHKCRYIPPPPILKPTKKCACFTPNGVVYARLETNDFYFERDFKKPHDHHRNISEQNRNNSEYFMRRGKCSNYQLKIIIIIVRLQIRKTRNTRTCHSRIRIGIVRRR